MAKVFFILFFIFLLVSSCGTTSKKGANHTQPLQWEHNLLNDTSAKLSNANKNTGSVSSNADALKLKNTPHSFEKFTQEWEGVPHRMGGMSKKGVDCSGFAILAYQHVLSHRFKYRRAQDIFNEVRPIEQSYLRYGDLVFFKINGIRISHMGIYLGQNQFAHASASQGVRISNLKKAYWQKRFYKGGRIKNL
jgi:lipoprotein Spr